MDNFLREVTHEYCKQVLLDSVMDSPTLRKKLSFVEHVNLCNYINENLGYEEGVNIVFELGVRDYESRFGALLKTGAASVVGGIAAHKLGLGKVGKIAGFGLGALLMYQFRKVTDPCWQACLKQPSAQKSICKYTCYIAGCNSVIRDILNQRGKCSQTKDPIKCTKGLNKALIKWKDRREKYREQLEKAKEKFAEREAVVRAKARQRELRARGVE